MNMGKVWGWRRSTRGRGVQEEEGKATLERSETCFFWQPTSHGKGLESRQMFNPHSLVNHAGAIITITVHREKSFTYLPLIQMFIYCKRSARIQWSNQFKVIQMCSLKIYWFGKLSFRASELGHAAVISSPFKRTNIFIHAWALWWLGWNKPDNSNGTISLIGWGWRSPNSQVVRRSQAHERQSTGSYLTSINSFAFICCSVFWHSHQTIENTDVCLSVGSGLVKD